MYELVIYKHFTRSIFKIYTTKNEIQKVLNEIKHLKNQRQKPVICGN